MIPAAAAPAALTACLMLAACAQPIPQAAGRIARICDSSGCVDRDPSIGSFHPQDDRRTVRTADSDPYHGERLADLRAAANAGDADAAYKLGEASLYGLGGAGRSVARAQQAFEMGAAADPGLVKAGSKHAHAAYNLANALLNGQGVPRDAYGAVRWLTVAAENGVAEAQYNLGLLCYRGDGMQQDLYEALQWMRRGAQGGYLPAQRAVGRLYMTGLDTMGQDLNEARQWLSMAAGRGDRQAQRWLSEVERALSDEAQQARQLQLQAAETATYLAAAVLAAALAPPPVTYIVY